MKTRLSVLIVLIPSLLLAQKKVMSIQVDGTINPASAAFIHRGIEKAGKENAECLIIQLNTPGGLLKSTRVIVSDILESPVPIVVFVSPGGAHAGSAGVFITLSAHIAAMAPGTNIGAAHPVDLQGKLDSVMSEKVTNDAAAFIRSIAEKRKRNIKWAEESVRKSISITEKEALKKNVIDVIAEDIEALANKIDGKPVTVGTKTKTLETRDAAIERVEMAVFERILDLISDPNVAYIFLLLGLYGMIFELYNPGAILPGIIGIICLTLAFYSMHTLPVNYAGLILIIFGVILFLLEIKFTSHGMLTLGGIVSLLLGSMMLIRPDAELEFQHLSWGVIISSVGFSALFFIFVLGMGIRAQRLKPVTGAEGMIGEIGESLEALNPVGTVRVHGEMWQAESRTGPIMKGARIRITGIKDLLLFVETAVE